MPHTNRKKKTTTNQNSLQTSTPRKSVLLTQHTKRKEVEDSDGWTHVIDAPSTRRSNKLRPGKGDAGSQLHTGDFEIDGNAYVNRTIEEMREEMEFWRKGWVGCKAEEELKRLLLGRGGETVEKEPSKKTGQVKGEDTASDSIQGVGNVAEGVDEPVTNIAEDLGTNPKKDEQVEAETVATLPNTRESASDSQGRRKIDKIVVLGLGSLQSARREARRASATQLAALQTITSTLESLITSSFAISDTKRIPVILQEPLFTPTDVTYLSDSEHGNSYEVVSSPEAFSNITEGSLVYAIHCYADVYKSVCEASYRPAVFIGTDIEKFGGLSNTSEEIYQLLKEMVEGCKVLDFPQLRHDFSDTKIYWRKETETTTQPITANESI